MDVKQKVLSCLENNKGNSISGSKIAQEIGVTRSAVWKAIKSLQNNGYDISATTNKGYSLETKCDIVSAQSIKPYLKNDFWDIETFKTIDSTNTYLKKLAQEGKKAGIVAISDEQTQGKGRMGRNFFSPSSKGIYMSILLRPKMALEQSLLVTTSMAVAVSRAIETVCEVETSIKWVNDIFIKNKKVCGILCEASVDFETGGLEYAVIGAGINVVTSKDDFPDEIKDIATSIFGEKTDNAIRSKLIAEILNNFYVMLDDLDNASFLEEYRKKSFVIGKEVSVISGNTSFDAKAIRIDDMARLVVKLKNGEEKTLNSGEVSVKIK